MFSAYNGEHTDKGYSIGSAVRMRASQQTLDRLNLDLNFL
jgi:hypothetical protein